MCSVQPLLLLVDDSPVQAEVRRAVLVSSGASVLVAGSGEEALSLLKDPDIWAAIGLMVTDHIMPGMAGPELVQRVRRQAHDLPILVLSGLPGADAEYPVDVVFRLKPFPPNELIRLTRHLLSDWTRRSA